MFLYRERNVSESHFCKGLLALLLCSFLKQMRSATPKMNLAASGVKEIATHLLVSSAVSVGFILRRVPRKRLGVSWSKSALWMILPSLEVQRWCSGPKRSRTFMECQKGLRRIQPCEGVKCLISTCSTNAIYQARS